MKTATFTCFGSCLPACTRALPPKCSWLPRCVTCSASRCKQIAALLGTEADGISKIIYRQRQQLKSGDIAFRSGFVWWSAGKVDLALKVLYVVFTEGWKIRKNAFCEDALSLTREVIRRARVSVPDAKALYALMLFQLSRWETRNERGR